jgi:CRP-like cAMP-binding protein
MQVCKSIKTVFDPVTFFRESSLERRILRLREHQAFYLQGDRADSIYYLEAGRARVTVVSRRGKEATVFLLHSGDFAGEESLFSEAGVRIATVRAITPCKVHRIESSVMNRLLCQEHLISDHLLRFAINRAMRVQADFIDQLFNSSEERLARILLLMAESDTSGALIPKISQETLAEMIGASRSQVNLFMMRFRRLGYIEFNGRIRVHPSLQKVIANE